MILEQSKLEVTLEVPAISQLLTVFNQRQLQPQPHLRLLRQRLRQRLLLFLLAQAIPQVLPNVTVSFADQFQTLLVAVPQDLLLLALIFHIHMLQQRMLD